VGISGIGFGFTAIGVADPIYTEAGKVENSLLVSFPQQRQQQRSAASRLIYCPDGLFGERASSMSPEKYASSFSTLRESSFLPRSVQHVNPMKLLASIYARPGFDLHHLRPSLLVVSALGGSRQRLPTKRLFKR
jgi:hypothetical protein